MRSSYAWTMKSWQRSEWRLGFNSVYIELLEYMTCMKGLGFIRLWNLLQRVQDLFQFSCSCYNNWVLLHILQASTNNTDVIALGKPTFMGRNTKKFPIALVESSISQYGPAVLSATVELSDSVTGQRSVVPIRINLVPMKKVPVTTGKTYICSKNETTSVWSSAITCLVQQATISMFIQQL